jgi:hypothetical protein
MMLLTMCILTSLVAQSLGFLIGAAMNVEVCLINWILSSRIWLEPGGLGVRTPVLKMSPSLLGYSSANLSSAYLFHLWKIQSFVNIY